MSGNDNLNDGNTQNPIVDERVVDLAVDRDQKVINNARHNNSTSGSSIRSDSEDGLVKKTKSKTASYFNVLFSGFALLSDGYQSGVISFVNLFLGKIYGTDVFNADMKSRLSYAMFVGAIIGQLGKVL
jgi:hypothetical protein